MIHKICLNLAATLFLWTVSPANAYFHSTPSQPMFRGMHKRSVQTLPSTSITRNDEKTLPSLQPATTCPFAQINKHYQKALKKIAESSLSQPLRSLLISQAAENQELAIKQANEKMRLCAKQACERLPYRKELLCVPKAVKILKSIDKINNF